MVDKKFSKILRDSDLFTSELYAMLIESRNHYSEMSRVFSETPRSKKKDKNDPTQLTTTFKNPDELKKFMRDFRETTTTTSVVSNSSFSYMHACFEKFMMNLLEYSIKSNTKFKNAYTSKFKNAAKNKDYTHLIDYSDSPSRRLSRLNDVCRCSHGIINLCRELLVMTGSKNNDHVFQDMCIRYIESRETNNILKHRGYSYDKEYVDRVVKLSKQELSQKINVDSLFKHVHVYNKKTKEKETTTKDNIIDKKVNISPTVYVRTFECLIYISSYFVYFLTKKSDRDILINEICHSLLFLCKDIKDGPELALTRLSHNISKLDKFQNSSIGFNNILAQIMNYKYVCKTELERSDLSEKMQIIKKTHLENIPKKMDLLKFENEKENLHYKKLLNLHFSDNTDEFLELSFSKNIIEKENYQNWALYIEYHNNKEFLKKYLEKYKKEFMSSSTIFAE